MIAQVNNVKLYYKKIGDGKPLILLHGNGESHEIFDKAVPLLAKRFTVYAIDLRGHGSSKTAAFHYEDMVCDVICFIQSLKIEKPVLYGFSDGGIIGLLLAARKPKLLSQLIISGANLVPEGIRRGWLTLFWINYAITRDSKMKMMLKEPRITVRMLQKIKVPTAVLAGSHDMIRRKHTKAIAAGIKNSTLHILKGEGHGSYIVHSEKIAYLILRLTKPKKEF